MTYILTTELYHHGIKGQKWGVRRFQNPDGTLTEAGKRRYGTVENFESGKTLKKIKKERAAIDKAVKSGDADTVRKNASKMTPQELQEAISRIQADTRIAELKTQQVAAGKSKLAEIVAVGTTVKNAAQMATEVYNLSAKMYNAFNKDGKKLPIIGENREKKAADKMVEFNLEREKQRFEWEKEKHNTEEANRRAKEASENAVKAAKEAADRAKAEYWRNYHDDIPTSRPTERYRWTPPKEETKQAVSALLQLPAHGDSKTEALGLEAAQNILMLPEHKKDN